MFNLFSDEPSCEETADYLKSLIDHLESRLAEDLGIDVSRSPSTPEEKAARLLTYALLRVSLADNPNVNWKCEQEIGGIVSRRPFEWLDVPIPDWSALAEDADASVGPDVRIVTAVMTGDVDHEECAELAYQYGANEVKGRVSEKRFNSIWGNLMRIDGTVPRAIKVHARSGPYEDNEDWLAMSLDPAVSCARRLAKRIEEHLDDEYGIGRDEQGLKRDDEAILGLFYLSCIPLVKEKAQAGEVHMSTALTTLKERLSGMSRELAESIIHPEIRIWMESNETSRRDGPTDLRRSVVWACSYSTGRGWGNYASEPRRLRIENRFQARADEAEKFVEGLGLGLTE